MIAIVVLLLALSAIFSGLTIGLLKLDTNYLERKIKLGNKDAEKIYEIRKNGNLLICTLNFANTLINVVVTTLMNKISPEESSNNYTGVVVAFITATCIFLFAEILPQALFSKYAFEFAARLTWLVKIFMKILWPLMKPISMVLDRALGEEKKEHYDKEELNAIMEEHVGETIDSDEQRIVAGVMGLSDKKAIDIITPVVTMFRLESKTVLTSEVLEKIKNEHYSRIPIYEDTRDNIVGILLVKDLLNFDVNSNKTAIGMCRKLKIMSIAETMKLDALMKLLLKEEVHMAFVYDDFHSLSGVVTLEDIFEELLKIEIIDESDTVADLQKQVKNQNRKKLIRE